METWKHITGHMAMNWVKEKKPPVMCWYWAAVLPAVMQPLQQPEEGSLLVLVEKGNTEHSGSAGTGFDHWESACTNPCSEVTPEEIAWAYVHEQDGYSNGIAHYIECREGYDRLLDMESLRRKDP